MIKPLIALLASSALAYKLVQHLGQKQQTRRAGQEGRQQRDEVHRWEAEGGNPAPAPEPAKPRRQRRASEASEG